jgi:hypothetical protein
VSSPITQLRPLNLGELLDTAFRIFRSQFVSLIGIAALLLLPMAVLQALASYSFSRILTGLTSFTSGAAPLPGQNPFDALPIRDIALAYALLIGLALIQGVVVNNLLGGALTAAVSRAYLGEPVDALGAFRLSIGHFPALAAASIVLGLALIFGISVLAGGCTVIGLLVAGGLSAVQDTERALGAAVVALLVVGLSLLVMLPVALFFATRFLLTTQAIVLERQGALGGLGRSWRLVGRSFWRTLVILVLEGMLLYLVASLPSGMISFVVVFASGGNQELLAVSNAISTLVSALGLILVQPLQFAIQTVLYYDLRTRSEGLDIELRSAQVRDQIATRYE